MTPVLYKTAVRSAKEIHPGDHVMLDSQHYLVKSAKSDNVFSAYSLNKDKRVDLCNEIEWDPSVQTAFIIFCSEHPDATDYTTSLKQELKRKTKWEGSDFFVTAMKCGREHSVDKECIIDGSITVTGCTLITPREKVNEGDHLIFNDLKNISHSVLVIKCLDHTHVTVKPPIDEGEILDLTTYPEVYRVNYSHCLPSKEALIRGSSKCGLRLAQKCSQDNQRLFVTWAKTGKELLLSSDLIEEKFSFEHIKVIDDIQIGDHMVEFVESNRRHFMVTEKCKNSMFTVIFCQAGGLIHEETVDLSCKELYRIVYLQKSLSVHEAIEQAKSQLGQQKHSPCCLLYTSPSPRDATLSRMPSSA